MGRSPPYTLGLAGMLMLTTYLPTFSVPEVAAMVKSTTVAMSSPSSSAAPAAAGRASNTRCSGMQG